jgi:exonuclease SbcC
MDQVAARFREQEKLREEPRTEIQAARARLEQELKGLLAEKNQVDCSLDEAAQVNRQLEAARTEMTLGEARLERRARLEANLQARRQSQADLRAENASLKPEMEKLDERIRRLQASEEAECPLCGQPLLSSDREALIERLKVDGKGLGDRFRDNKGKLQELEEDLRDLESQIGELSHVEAEIRQHTARMAQLETQLEAHNRRSEEWQASGAPRLQAVQKELEKELYASQARKKLKQIDAELKKIGYDAAAHDAARQAEEVRRASEPALRELERAQAALAPLDREIQELEKQTAELQAENTRQKAEYEQAAERLAEAESLAPDLYEAESLLLDLQEQENRSRMELGAAQQKVAVLESLKIRRSELEGEREASAYQVQLYKQLERAFGKDGVPALLIEQALPEIESKANETLARLSGGVMSVRFVTQAQYKDRNREDLKETLDIQISDSAGTRDYEMFSGGEAFRVNFAIRLALSEVLAQRAGARLQTLVIDEGFGSQDAQGRQRLIEAINLVRADFAKILVITHIDELKDAFPNRIEVEKTDLGSIVRVV